MQRTHFRGLGNRICYCTFLYSTEKILKMKINKEIIKIDSEHVLCWFSFCMNDYKDESEQEMHFSDNSSKSVLIQKIAYDLPKDQINEDISQVIKSLILSFESGNYNQAEISLISIDPVTILSYLSNLSLPVLEEFSHILIHFLNSESPLDIISQVLRIIYNLLLSKENEQISFTEFFLSNGLLDIFSSILNETNKEEVLSIDFPMIYQIIALLCHYSDESFESGLSFIDFNYFDLSLTHRDKEMVKSLLFFIQNIVTDQRASALTELLKDSIFFGTKSLEIYIKERDKEMILLCLGFFADLIRNQKECDILSLIKENELLLKLLNDIFSTFGLSYFPLISEIYLALSETEKLPPFMLKTFVDAVASSETLDHSLNSFFINAVRIISFHLFDNESETFCIKSGCINALRMICEDCSYTVRKEAILILIKFIIQFSNANPENDLFDCDSEEMKDIQEIYSSIQDFDEENDEFDDAINELFDILESFPIIET